MTTNLDLGKYYKAVINLDERISKASVMKKAGDWPNKNRNFAVQNLKKVVYFLNC